ncbi:MAG: LysR family transcriptional regulator [Desulfobacter sp.]|nr:LysR family transcriptional regulator [Desulfobacter sp.]WDP86386.1 MAG: LysR family transcriptional regulator [Desulfobacter sp.]
MELYQLRTFVTVAEESHLTRAACRLNTSQPSVSAHIKALEQEFGIALFKRSKKGMHLTGQGKVLLEKAKTVLASSVDLFNQAEKLKGNPMGEVRIGLNAQPDLLRVNRLFEAGKIMYPGLKFQLIQKSSHRVEKALKAGAIACGYFLDAAVAPGIATRSLGKIEFWVTGPADWEQKLNNANIHHIKDLPWVVNTEGCRLGRIIRQHFDLGIKELNTAVEADDEAMIGLIRAGAGLGFMEKSAAKAAYDKGQVAIWQGKPLCVDLLFAFLDARRDDPVIEAMHRLHDTVWQPSD